MILTDVNRQRMMANRERVLFAFEHLNAAGILAKGNHLCCRDCGSKDLLESATEERGYQGIAFWHFQAEDALRQTGELCIHYDRAEDSILLSFVAQQILTALEMQGLQGECNGESSGSIRIDLLQAPKTPSPVLPSASPLPPCDRRSPHHTPGEGLTVQPEWLKPQKPWADLFEKAQTVWRRQKHEKALKLLEECLALAQSTTGSAGDLAGIEEQIGILEDLLGRRDEAFLRMQRVATDLLRQYDVRHPLAAYATALLADAYDRRGMLDTAEQNYEKALQAFAETCPPTDRQWHACLMMLMHRAEEQGRAFQVLSYGARLLLLQHEACGGSCICVADRALDLAERSWEAGQTMAARELYRQAYPMLLDTYGPDALSTQLAAFGLARIAVRERRYAEADGWLADTLRRLVEPLPQGADHSHPSWRQDALLQTLEGDEQWYQRTRVILRTRILATRTALAALRQRDEEIEKFAELTLESIEKLDASDQWRRIPILRILGRYNDQQGRYQESLNYFDSAVWEIETTYPQDHCQYAAYLRPCLVDLAWALYAAGKEEESQIVLNRARALGEDTASEPCADELFDTEMIPPWDR